jgi:hypothetical protein
MTVFGSSVLASFGLSPVSNPASRRFALVSGRDMQITLGLEGQQRLFGSSSIGDPRVDLGDMAQDVFHNPHLLEQPLGPPAWVYFHRDATHNLACLLGRRVKLIELLLCFKTANQDDVEHSFGIAIGNNVAASSAMLWVRVNWCQVADSLTNSADTRLSRFLGSGPITANGK